MKKAPPPDGSGASIRRLDRYLIGVALPSCDLVLIGFGQYVV
jgi:hypothetical protein